MAYIARIAAAGIRVVRQLAWRDEDDGEAGLTSVAPGGAPLFELPFLQLVSRRLQSAMDRIPSRQALGSARSSCRVLRTWHTCPAPPAVPEEMACFGSYSKTATR